MELHMFHESAQGKAAVIGVFYEIGAHDAFLHKLEPYLEMIADRKDREEKMGMMDPRGARRKASVYYRYVGSLTTPPCSEGVIWTIVKRVRTVSRHQLELLREAVHDVSSFFLLHFSNPLQILVFSTCIQLLSFSTLQSLDSCQAVDLNHGHLEIPQRHESRL
ncbi:unnamed protein product [Triticum turgidum subsp. durum]|uniref:Alpha-carbonic anhydrase domain-containing protein n=2 Tax=Triticum TaxID=4564 RepID=A0A9R0SMU8_TRITD|nr:unnamed protein product [Triticum turgidum subsp. durum]